MKSKTTIQANPSIKIWVMISVVIMAIAWPLANMLSPKKVFADTLPQLILEDEVPQSFGEWRILEGVKPVLPDPTVTEQLASLYSNTLNRVYVRSDGARIMLSIAYGKNQNSASTAAHRPEFCYSAQGFVVKNAVQSQVNVEGQGIKVINLLATAGKRIEPITYWVTLGHNASIPGFDRKLQQLVYGLNGWIMDGMLMRVSSLTEDEEIETIRSANQLHEVFLNDLSSAMNSNSRKRFFGERV